MSTLYGPHCSHDDLCSMFGCDQRGHIDFPCRKQSTCTFCHPDSLCPSLSATDPDVTVADCPECHVSREDLR